MYNITYDECYHSIHFIKEKIQQFNFYLFLIIYLPVSITELITDDQTVSRQNISSRENSH